MSTIWYVSKYFALPEGPSAGGRSYELLRELAALGHDCVAFVSDANHLNESPRFTGTDFVQDLDGFRICWVRTARAGEAKSWRRILGWLHFESRLWRLRKRRFGRRPDVVIVSSPSLLSFVTGVLWQKILRTRLVVEVRDIWPLTLVDEGGFSPRNPFVAALAFIERWGYRKADLVVGTMPRLDDHVAAVLGATKPVECIPMGYAPRALPTLGGEPSHPREEFVVGYAGTVGISNALETLFETATALRDDPSIRFVILGDGGLLPRYERDYAHLPNVTFRSRVPKNEVATILGECDVLYLSTHRAALWHYGQSLNKLVDYMLAGRPIIASYSGYPSMINEAACGSFVPAEDVPSLVTALCDYRAMPAEQRKEMGKRGREWLLAHRSYPLLAQQYAHVLFD